MKRLSFLLTIIFNLFSATMWGEDFLVNYYHKGAIVHTQQITEGSAIGTLPELNLTSCDDKINIFVGWIAEADIAKYQTANTTTPTFITEEYTPTTNTNLYAVFADGKSTGEFIWQQVKSKSELKDNDQIIITAHSHNYAISKTFNKDKQLVALEITKSEDKSTITPNEDVQIFTLEKINEYLWGIRCEAGYLGNPSTSTNNTIIYYTKSNDWSKWGITINATNYSTQIKNNKTNYHPYLYFHVNNNYFACTSTNYSNLAIYKQTPIFEVNYLSCTMPDAVECTIRLHDGEKVSEIKCKSNESITQPTSTQEIDHWHFYGWTTAPVNKTTTAPEIITFPYTPTNNIDLYAVYSNTTADSLMMTNKTIPANWQVKETRNNDTVISLFSSSNYIEIPAVENITKIEIEARKDDTYDYKIYVITEKETLIESIGGNYKTYSFDINYSIKTSIKIMSTSIAKTKGVVVRNIVVHHLPIYSSTIEQDNRYTISLESNTDKDLIKHYTISQSRGKDVNLPKNTFSNESLEFIEWNTNADGADERYNDEATIQNITADITLYAQWGTIETIESKETLNIENETTINKLIIKSDVQGYTGKIKIDNNAQLKIKDIITFEKEIDNTRYHFFSLPFDCNIIDIEATTNTGNELTYAINDTEGDWVICSYNQTLAANNAGDSKKNAWTDILDKHYTLKANQGYIVGYFTEDEKVTLKFTSKKPQIISTPIEKTYNLGADYEWYTNGENISANGWNLIGQPYYETLTQGSLTNYVTIPNDDGKTYTQCLYKEALAKGLITPFSAFFVQLQENSAPTIRTEKLDYALYNGEASDFMHIYLSDGKMTDRTSIFNNNQLTADYEIDNDLKKWIGYAESPQIYTIENDIPLAYNVQKIDETSILKIGIYAPTEGEYTFAANENCQDIHLIDNETNTTTNLAQSDYTVHLTEGTNNDRFKIYFQKTTSTQLITNNTKIEYFVQNGTIWIKNLPPNSYIYIYDCTGKIVGKSILDHYCLPYKGLYHIIIMQNDIKIDNFDAIY